MDATLLLPHSKSSRCHSNHKRPRTQLYGYVLTDEWLMDYATKYQLGGPHNQNDAVAKVLRKIICTAGLSKVFTVIWDGNPPVCQALALAVEVRVAPKDCIDRVKEVLEHADDPSWYMAI
ncbi:hypothetical protein PILCRDRAFT_829618 [Piloderma croceum F 1598]|uniref:Uncharacterized protein n=1 Tax=Piloderma croceum (strain F 1598) TaxID=765440 RepID=A0A0C3AFW2_PILCF|nr:hypothetical protein PILCRDRAFT_829618 [Piloderma croceum F 1598]